MIIEARKQSYIESIFLHIMPGILLTAFTYVMTYIFRAKVISSFLFLEIGSIVILLPWVLLILNKYKKVENANSIKELIIYHNKSKWYEYIIYCFVTLLLAVIVLMIFGKTIHLFIKESVFFWLPKWLDISDIFANSKSYSKNMILTVWFFGIITTGITAPILEEIYFRGFLLPRIRGNEIVVIIIGSVLFGFYNCWNLWMLPGRIIIVALLICIVLKKRNIIIALYAHCLLNLIGDTLFSIPIVFH